MYRHPAACLVALVWFHFFQCYTFMHSLHFQIEDICAFSAVHGEMRGSVSSEGVVTLQTSLLMCLDVGAFANGRLSM